MAISDYLHGVRRSRDKFNFALGRSLFDRNLPPLARLESCDSVLIVRSDGKIGDSLVASFIYPELKKANPNISIGVLCTANTAAMYESNPAIDHVHHYPKRAKLWQVKKLISPLPYYQAVIFLPETVKARDFLMLRCLKAQLNIGIAQGVGLINCNIREQVLGKPSQQYFIEAAKRLGVTVEDANYRYTLPAETEQAVLGFLAEMRGQYIALNPFGNAGKRSFTEDRLIQVAAGLREAFPELPLVILASPNSQALVSRVAERLAGVHCLAQTQSIDQNAALIKHSKLFISVDTATVHLARCFASPMVAIYRPDPANFAMWQPNYQPTEVVFSREPSNSQEEVNIGEFDLTELLQKCRQLLARLTTESAQA
ncbi:glycosyltransferase family 9 protein [Agarivorans gilvus]|uniref:LOS biosynthesis enzyme LBGB n=1 Tax=Agarivorans gilvus TaxID=680279 RepID=A0ABQ1I1P4_9ALTE|nr:glycosyltransferase family 9 protein [Agarivorans gilvus]GGB03891.1 LOS biosynthesis enzyme LBGB [Agarivorans gilvus]